MVASAFALREFIRAWAAHGRLNAPQNLSAMSIRGHIAGRCLLRRILLLVVLVSLSWPAQAETEWRISSIGVRDMDFYAVSDGSGYAVVLTNSASSVERRCYSNGHHFLSILSTDGIFALRPHPGVDLNGWGSTLYLQPFLPAAVLQGSVVTDCTAYADRIEIAATGTVSRGVSAQYGAWELELTCSYDRLNKSLSANGLYAIELAAPLDDTTGDLNLLKLASNYLDDVPLVDGTTNDTGDMAYAQISAGTLVTNWNPSLSPGYFPTEQTSNLHVNVLGAFNSVDTRAQGHHAIQAAYKPSLSFSLESRQEDIPMIFGGIYETNSAKDFAADNVGITPLVLRSSSATQFQFDVSMESHALAGDGVGITADISAAGVNSVSTVEVYYTDRLTEPFRRYVGKLDITGSNEYNGKVAVPYPESGASSKGFFRIEIP